MPPPPSTASGAAFRDWSGESTNTPREIAEAALAHVVGDATERAYRRGDALEKRRQLMEAWAIFVIDRRVRGAVASDHMRAPVNRSRQAQQWLNEELGPPLRAESAFAPHLTQEQAEQNAIALARRGNFRPLADVLEVYHNTWPEGIAIAAAKLRGEWKAEGGRGRPRWVYSQMTANPARRAADELPRIIDVLKRRAPGLDERTYDNWGRGEAAVRYGVTRRQLADMLRRQPQ